MPGQTMSRFNCSRYLPGWLQWRAGQLPGQTARLRRASTRSPTTASMEGRAIARPNVSTTFVGAAGVPCSALQWRAGQLPGQTGRPTVQRRPRVASLQWRAGQLPGQTGMEPDLCDYIALQWRAGQLPGQTRQAVADRCHPHPRFNGGPGNCPAKPIAEMPDVLLPIVLQWRAGQLPGQTAAASRQRVLTDALQWRAGQLPGQTS